MKLQHQFFNQSFFIPDWNIKHLFLGTFNPMGGENVPYFYARRRNQTWPILSRIFNENFDPYNKDFFNLLKKHELACMDMIASVEFEDETKLEFIVGKGYSDSKIINNKVRRGYATENIQSVINKNPNCKVYSTWGHGSKLKEWLFEINKISNKTPLVSPSLVAKVPSRVNKSEYIYNDWKSKILLK